MMNRGSSRLAIAGGDRNEARKPQDAILVVTVILGRDGGDDLILVGSWPKPTTQTLHP